MKSVSGKALAKILESKGWKLVKVRGSHFKYQKDENSVSVPVHGNRDLPTGTLKAIMKDANLINEDLL